MPDARTLRVARFGPFRLDIKAGELHKDGQKIRLQEQPFRILEMLLKTPGSVVTREEIRKKLWPNDTVVEFDHSINAAIKKLRLALGDSAEEPHYVETVARRGYRLLVSVEWPDARPTDAPVDQGPSEPPTPVTTNLIGRRVSHYRVLEVLGGGGMGMVYKAEDLKLGRCVALKFLAEEFISDHRALERFEREARAISALDHANICTIYEVEEYERQPFIVMQLLQGQTLRQRIESAGPERSAFSQSELLNFGIQIVTGLEAAHQKGIIHRDIKPANIFVTNRGEIKLLDFGLAKLMDTGGVFDESGRSQRETGPPDASVAPTASQTSVSLTGVMIGTASYMSPEQVRRESLDPRSDLFSFGVVLYEMATGRQPFRGSDLSSIWNAILNEVPPSPLSWNPDLPHELAGVIGRAMERDRLKRYQAASEIICDLKRTQVTGSGRVTTPKTYPGLNSAVTVEARRHTWTTLGSLAIVAGLLFVAAGYVAQKWTTEQPLPPVEVVPLVDLQGKEGSPAASPDGSQVAFAEFGQHNAPGIYTALIDGGRVHRLTENSGDCCPTWSPDNRQIAFVRYSESGREMAFYEISSLGGTEHKLYKGPANIRSGCGRIDWSPDGRSIAFSEPSVNGLRSRISLLFRSDLSTRQLTSPADQQYDCEPAFSPDGVNIAFARGSLAGNRRDLFVVRVSGGEPRSVASGHSSQSPVWTQDGKEIVFSSQLGGLLSLWRISASGGIPRPVAGVGAVAFMPSVSRKADQLVYQHVVASDAIWRIELKDPRHSVGSPAPLISSRGINWRPSFSPDGKKIVFESDRLGYSDMWYCDSDGTNCSQLTSLRGTAGAGSWSPDGHYVAFEFQSQGYYQIYAVEVPGGQPRLLPTFPASDNGAPTWSRDGRWIYFYTNHEKGLFQLWKVSFRGGSPVKVTSNGGVHAIESDDGRFLYYSKVEQPGLWMAPINGGEEKRILDQPPGFDWHSWVLAKRGIYYLNARDPQNATIEFFDFAKGQSTPIIRLKSSSSYHGLTASPNGRSILYVQNESADSYIMLVKHFQ